MTPQVKYEKAKQKLCSAARWEPQASILLSETIRRRTDCLPKGRRENSRAEGPVLLSVLKCIKETEKWVELVSEHTFRQPCGVDFIYGIILLIKQN